MKKTLFALALMVLASSSFAGTNTLSARELNEYCYKNEFICVGYILGFLDGTARRTKNKISVGTLENIFKKEMALHPENGDDSAPLILLSLLIKHDLKLKYANLDKTKTKDASNF